MSKNKSKNKNKIKNIESNNSNESVKLNDKQLELVLKEIRSMHENQNDQINKSLKEIGDLNLIQNKVSDNFSRIVRWTMFSLFIVIGIILTLGVLINICTLLSPNIFNNIAVIILLILGIILIILGFSIIKIDDRNYLISVFSAIVALAALIVAIYK